MSYYSETWKRCSFLYYALLVCFNLVYRRELIWIMTQYTFCSPFMYVMDREYCFRIHMHNHKHRLTLLHWQNVRIVLAKTRVVFWKQIVPAERFLFLSLFPFLLIFKRNHWSYSEDFRTVLLPCIGLSSFPQYFSLPLSSEKMLPTFWHIHSSRTPS